MCFNRPSGRTEIFLPSYLGAWAWGKEKTYILYGAGDIEILERGRRWKKRALQTSKHNFHTAVRASVHQLTHQSLRRNTLRASPHLRCSHSNVRDKIKFSKTQTKSQLPNPCLPARAHTTEKNNSQTHLKRWIAESWRITVVIAIIFGATVCPAPHPAAAPRSHGLGRAASFPGGVERPRGISQSPGWT